MNLLTRLSIPLTRRTPRSANAGGFAVAADNVTAQTDRQAQIRDLVGDLPIFERVAPAYFHQIAAPIGAVIPARCSAWYGLSSLSPGQNGLPEFGFAGCDVDMLSPDVSGTGITGQVNPVAGADPKAVAWGDANGNGCAMVVGINLPCGVGAWSYAPADIPGMDPGVGYGAARTLGSQNGANDYLLVEHFPPGDLGLGTGWIRAFRNILGSVRPVPTGSRLDIALVIGAKYLQGLAAGTRIVCGRGSIRPFIIRPNPGVTWTR